MPFPIILIIFHTSSFSSPYLMGFFRCTDPRRDCTSFHGKKGLKAHRECSWQKIKAKTIAFQMLAQRGLKNNETFSLKIKDLQETISHI
jgi:hypothetical protein